MKLKALLHILILLTCICSTAVSQSLNSSQVTHIKNATVQILINGKPSGTGFIVNPQGSIVTCYHVIAQALTQQQFNISAKLNSGETLQLGIVTQLLTKYQREAFGFDCCFLIPTIKSLKQYEFLKVGTFHNAQEGDEVFTVGYPLGIEQPILAKGLVSTKWSQWARFQNHGKLDSVKRDVAWLDMTMNRGNSGGAIIKIALNPMDDEVVGIATFILNPYGPIAEQLSNAARTPGADIEMNGISQMKSIALLSEAISNNSIGVSGCISIDHIISIVNEMNKDPK